MIRSLDMSLLKVSHDSALMDWPQYEGIAGESDARTSLARRENLRRRARLLLANYLALGENEAQLLKLAAQAETADDIDFGRSDCEFLFRD
jgi:tRNA(Ile)-lysidine synthase TilS/MesJ